MNSSTPTSDFYLTRIKFLSIIKGIVWEVRGCTPIPSTIRRVTENVFFHMTKSDRLASPVLKYYKRGMAGDL